MYLCNSNLSDAAALFREMRHNEREQERKRKTKLVFKVYFPWVIKEIHLNIHSLLAPFFVSYKHITWDIRHKVTILSF